MGTVERMDGQIGGRVLGRIRGRVEGVESLRWKQEDTNRWRQTRPRQKPKDFIFWHSFPERPRATGWGCGPA